MAIMTLESSVPEVLSWAGRLSTSTVSVLVSAETVSDGEAFLLSSMLLGMKKLSKKIPAADKTIRSNMKWKFSGQPRPMNV